ncbi:uncharacterized protein ASCRUDRAFT_71635 [Ascoidea rubescens DSM 1968]|uniref:Uncharacterized protein n=1 Tax=Ascoidea rubescens DSM 1968 TaxID=1344418 RepID=A0A1D2VDM1_9ASCO|nr:hypothetical protein ASCRUDRAFT_71635 [Ascoidea rubescens DSM 1968]ODV59699.1 hypothetical protein ASCRUDRAFT_71635 [Ascoidea rubescens DSM 1968]
MDACFYFESPDNVPRARPSGRAISLGCRKLKPVTVLVLDTSKSGEYIVTIDLYKDGVICNRNLIGDDSIGVKGLYDTDYFYKYKFCFRNIAITNTGNYQLHFCLYRTIIVQHFLKFPEISYNYTGIRLVTEPFEIKQIQANARDLDDENEEYALGIVAFEHRPEEFIDLSRFYLKTVYERPALYQCV